MIVPYKVWVSDDDRLLLPEDISSIRIPKELWSTAHSNFILNNSHRFLRVFFFKMGLLSILKKMKQKEKEMRLLILYPFT